MAANENNVPQERRVSSLENDLKKYGPTLTPDDVAEVLQLSRRTVDDYIKAGIIDAFPLDPSKERKQYRVTKAALMAYITNKN